MTELQKRIGIFIGLDEETYHNDRALGSTDVRLLVRGSHEYWYQSPLNPLRPKRRDTGATIYGTAVHKLVLEGLPAFERLYSRRPDDHVGATTAEKAKITRTHNQECDAAGRTGLHGDDYDRAMICSAMISKNPDLVNAISGGLSEVSIFWEEPVIDPADRDGKIRYVRCKARFDYLKPRGIGDLKNISNPFKTDFVECCWHAIASRRLDIQAELYLRGRARMRELLDGGRVMMHRRATTATTAVLEHDRDVDLLRRIVNSDEFAWQWIFYQADDAPIVYSESLSPGNEILEVARQDVDAALVRFVRCWDADTWIDAEPVREASIDNLPPWYARSTRRPRG